MNTEFQERLTAIEARIAAACARAGRQSNEVRLLPVSKTFGPDIVADAARAGLTVFGENRVQEARQKIPLCPGHLRWHLVGHLQSNKVKEAVSLFQMIHSIDSPRLLTLVDAACRDQGRTLPVLLEVNVSGESSKYGLPPDAVPEVLRLGNTLFQVQIAGFMTIPPAAEDPEAARPFFRRLRELRDAWSVQQGVRLPELSMGMSGDFEIAIEEGATWVRIGALLFGPRRAAAPAPPT
jgi:pyridoxal phosphate enzyme (YggS family)